MEKRSDWIRHWMDQYGMEFQALSQEIWGFAETGMEETRSAAALCEALEQHGFQVERNLAGIPTAFAGSFGSGKPVIGFLGEFDALEGLSQQAGVWERNKLEGQENGHGCGHNLLGCGSLAAAAAVKAYMEEYHLPGTLRYYGCPGEEKGCGKMHMANAGCFQELDAVLTWHPSDHNSIEGASSLADLCMEFHFTGKSAHAAACPHLGRSALDAVELLNIACNFMREHIIPEARIHYAITDTGGAAPNIIPSHASVVYEARAPKLEQALDLQERLVKAAQGAALMTDTAVETVFGDQYSDYVPNHCLNLVAWENMKELGCDAFSAEEKELASHIQETFPIDARGDTVLDETLTAYTGLNGCLAASTDVGNVSQLVPTVQLYTACCAAGTPAHSWQMVSQTGSPIGVRGMLTAGKLLALTAIDLLCRPELLQRAWEEHQQAMSHKL